ncbi:MAG: elongation factor G [Chloroflexi bacterium]|nr:elongation factor G [Chloroflexota bacterium]
MKKYKVADLRNVALLGHGGAGKTSLSEAMLFNVGTVSRFGRIEDGNTISDYDPEEIRRHISINTSILPCETGSHKINILDVPGYVDFVGDVKAAIRVTDGAIMVIDAVSGVEVGTELQWEYANERHFPRLIFVNKMDRDNANFSRAVDSIRELLGCNPVPIQLPIGRESSFRGIVDVVRKRAMLADGSETDVPDEMLDEMEDAYQQLVEAAAESDDELILKYLEGEELTNEEVRQGLRASLEKGAIVPVLCGSATRNIGVKSLLAAIEDLMPSPLAAPIEIADPLALGEGAELQPVEASPLATLVFKTMADPFVGKLTYFRVFAGVLESDSRVFNPRSGQEERIGQLYRIQGKEQTPVEQVGPGDFGGVAKLSSTLTGDTLCDKANPLVLKDIQFPHPVYSASITPETQSDLDKLSSALTRLVEEDPTITVEREKSTNETILSGMGESHIEVAVQRMRQKFGVSITTDIPKVPYLETITEVTSAHGRHKKQTGGRGQFGDVYIRFEPLPRGTGFEFVDEIFGGSVPRNFIPAVEKGLREIIPHGVLAGYPTVDIRAALYDGSYHPVDSSEIAFKLAAHAAFKEAIPRGKPVLLEPIMAVTISVPDQFMGDILGDLNTKRARVQGMDQQRGKAVITALVPLAEMQRYATDVRSMTQGRGYFSMEHSHYDVVPDYAAQSVIAKAEEEKK